MRCLVTGATGFIGSAVVRDAVARGWQVAPLTHQWLRGATVADLRAHIAAANVQSAVLLGWIAEPGRYLNDVEANEESADLACRLLDTLADLGIATVLAGTCLERIEQGPGASAYAVAKRRVHRRAADLGSAGARMGCGHIFWVYGPNEHPQRVIASVAASLVQGRTVDVTAGTQRRDFLHVDDVAAGLRTLVADLAASTSGRFECLDICSGTSVPMTEVFEYLGCLSGRPELLRIGARSSSDADSFEVFGDPARLRSLGWRARFDLETGLRQVLEGWRSLLELEGEPR